MSRYVVHESWGKLSDKPSARADGVTCTVHDTVNVYRVVGKFRSELMPRKRDRPSRAEARERADELAARLNAA